ncbi:unnamed protein product [Caenorhabditis bovis]|uniref:LITAF domain-containing protein n=1 Tax=Caenorhabditis bovis TaxID=2654633 RepID=A0A8S1F476_9PELO|nr:unnamed protein product [Caenorhabditis bovis]
MASENQPPPSYEASQNEQNGRIPDNSNFVISRASPYNTSPIEMDCPYCQNHIVSHIDKVAGILPWVLCIVCGIVGLILFILPWFLCCVPFLLDPCLDVVHTCPACKRVLGRYNRV